MSGQTTDRLVVGQITSVYGVKGWVKVHSYTEPAENIFSYDDLWLESPKGWQPLVFDETKVHGKGLVAHIKGVDDRDLARDFCQREIAVTRADIPALDDGEFYWHQLQGLRVVTHYQGQEKCLGVVKQLMETGANDVLVVKGSEQGENPSIDRRERLIPYTEQCVMQIDLDAGVMTVDWDPEF